MQEKEIVQKALEFTKRKLGNEKTGHDFWHAYRVWILAKFIAKKEGVDQTLEIELAAILHDIADRKTFGEEKGMEMIRNFLRVNELSNEQIEKICEIIGNISFSKGKVPESVEGKIVQDADRLDAIGAIGIARCFAYGGKNDRVIYDPENIKDTSIWHFYEKLLKLKDRMHTQTAKEIAEKRHNFMKLFLEEFFKEWNVEDVEEL